MIEESEFQIGMKRLENIVRSFRSFSAEDRSEDVRKINVCNVCGHTWKVRAKHPHPRLCPKCRSSFWDSSMVARYKCNRCDYEWRSESLPVRCPSCRTRTWNSPQLDVSCRICGHQWKDPAKVFYRLRCPVCGDSDSESIVISPRKDSYEEAQDIRTVLTEETVRASWLVEDPYFRTVTLVNRGLSPKNANIVVRFDNGSTATAIALEMSIPICDVMSVISDYSELIESMG